MPSALGGGRGNQKADVSTDKLLEYDSDKGRGKKNWKFCRRHFSMAPQQFYQPIMRWIAISCWISG